MNLTIRQAIKALKKRTRRECQLAEASGYTKKTLDRAVAVEGQQKVFENWAKHRQGKTRPPFDPNSPEWLEELEPYLKPTTREEIEAAKDRRP